MGTDLRITSEPMAPESDARAVSDGLSLYNVARTGYDHWRPMKLFVRDGSGMIRGGILGHIWGGWLHITDLWLQETARGAGLGLRLMETAEDEARADGCRYVYLDSHSFQAPDFYRKLGYKEFGRLKDSPLGHEQVFLWKRL
jgi:ribosomal protein S18 acetylase RimI-like enzyme